MREVNYPIWCLDIHQKMLKLLIQLKRTCFRISFFDLLSWAYEYLLHHVTKITTCTQPSTLINFSQYLNIYSIYRKIDETYIHELSSTSIISSSFSLKTSFYWLWVRSSSLRSNSFPSSTISWSYPCRTLKSIALHMSTPCIKICLITPQQNHFSWIKSW